MLRWFVVCTLVAAGFWTVSAFGAEPSTSKDWPQWRGPNRDDISPQTGLLKNWEAQAPKLDWKVQGIGGGYASVAIVGDRLYTTGNLPDGQAVFAIDLDKH